MTTSTYPDLNFLTPRPQGPLFPAPPQQTGPQGQINWTPNRSSMPSSPGFGYSQSPVSFSPPGGGQNPPTMLDQAWLAFLNDFGRMQGAADQQHSLMGQEAQAVGQHAQHWAGNIQGMAGDTSNFLQNWATGQQHAGEQNAQQLGQYGDSLDFFADQGNPELHSTLQAAYGKADLAESGFQQAIGGFQDRGAMDASSVSAGLQRNAQSKLEEAKQALNSGMINQGQFLEIKNQIDQDTTRQVADATTQIYDHVNDQLVGLQNQLAQLRSMGAQTRISGAGLLGQEYATKTQAKGLAGELKRASAEMDQRNREFMGGVMQAITQIRNAGTLSAAQLAVQGREAQAQFIQNNPHSIVSLFSGLSAMLALATAPGIGGIGASTVPGRMA